LVVVLTGFAPAPRAGINTSTPPELVASYQSLADAILAVKKTEADLVRAILAATYRHAEGMLAQAQAKLKANQPAKEEIEGLASLVSQLGNGATAPSPASASACSRAATITMPPASSRVSSTRAS
jgi:hypothetical protein